MIKSTRKSTKKTTKTTTSKARKKTLTKADLQIQLDAISNELAVAVSKNTSMARNVQSLNDKLQAKQDELDKLYETIRKMIFDLVLTAPKKLRWWAWIRLAFNKKFKVAIINLVKFYSEYE